MRVIITEKPSCSRALSNIAARHWPGEEIVLIACVFTAFSSTFSFPRNLNYASLPMVAEPKYKPESFSYSDDNLESFHVIRIRKDRQKDFDIKSGRDVSNYRADYHEASRIIQLSDEIVCATDCDPAGALIFNLVLEYMAPKFLGKNITTIINYAGYDEKSLTMAFNRPTMTSDDFFKRTTSAGIIKRYFDYNFMLNSHVILSDLYRFLASTKAPVEISKYMLLLLHLVNCNKPMDWYQLETKMLKWSGSVDSQSGAKVASIGSPASRSSIIKNLVNLDLIKADDKDKYGLTDLGERFIAALHKDSFDPFLPQRIADWQLLSIEEATAKIDKYMKTFFGKQKRYQSKIIFNV